MSELGKRVAFAVVAAPLAIWVLYIGGAPFAALLSIVAAIGAWELFRIARAGSTPGMDSLGIVGAALLPLYVYAYHVGFVREPITPPAVGVLVILGASIWLRGVEGKPLSASAVTVFGILYTGGMLSFAYPLRYLQYAMDARSGAAVIAFPVLLTWASDIGAYFVGRAIGGRKLIPSVSPGKTVAGAVGGLVFTIIVAWALARFALPPLSSLSLTVLGAVVFGALVSIAAQVGDLAESLLKREAGVKDSSRIIPGHGGVLDRFDSLLFVLPISYLVLPRLLVPVIR